MTRVRVPLATGVAGTCWLSVLTAPAAAHGGSVTGGVPGWVVLFGSVLGLLVGISGGVVVADRLLQSVLGAR